MRINRCVKLDYGHLGCVIDATELAGDRCNAKRKCEIRVPDPQFASLRPCPDDLKPYLEVAYDCLRGSLRLTCRLNVVCFWCLTAPKK